jgi:hypothetical protein
MNIMLWFDAGMLPLQTEGLQRGLRLIEASDEWKAGRHNSPRWVTCPKCTAYRGDPCRTGEWCQERIVANRERLLTLPTWAAPWESPCCGSFLYLVWRSSDPELSWSGIPCFSCGKTYTANAHESDLVAVRVQADRVNPQLVEMTCWATTEARPWKTPTRS